MSELPESMKWQEEALRRLNLQQKAVAMEAFLLEVMEAEGGPVAVHKLVDGSRASAGSKEALLKWVDSVAKRYVQAALDRSLPKEVRKDG